MAEQEPKQSGFDNSWAAWKDRLGIGAVLVALAMLFFFMFTDASLNFQCSVTDFVMMKCNRFDRTFKKWEDDKPKPAGSSYVPVIDGGGKIVGLRFNIHAGRDQHQLAWLSSSG